MSIDERLREMLHKLLNPKKGWMDNKDIDNTIAQIKKEIRALVLSENCELCGKDCAESFNEYRYDILSKLNDEEGK